jgi:hypothetical protein
MFKHDVEIGGKRRQFFTERDGDTILLLEVSEVIGRTAPELPIEVTYRSTKLDEAKKMAEWEIDMYSKLRDKTPDFGHFQGMLFGVRKDMAYLEKLERTFNTVGIV